MIRRALAAVAVAAALSGCATVPTASQSRQMEMTVQAASMAALVVANAPGISPQTRARVRRASASLDAAWAAYSASLAKGEPGDTAALAAALAGLRSTLATADPLTAPTSEGSLSMPPEGVPLH